jgi:hypothetical protein
MNEIQIKQMIVMLHFQCKKQYNDQQSIVDQLDFRDSHFQIENYMAGYLKGQYKIMEHLLKSI